MIHISRIPALQRAAALAHMQLAAMPRNEDANVQRAFHSMGIHLSQTPAKDVASAVGQLTNILHVGNGELQSFSILQFQHGGDWRQ